MYTFHPNSIYIFTCIWHRMMIFLKTNGSLFKGQLLLHGNVHLTFLSFILRSRGRCVFTTRQFNHFSPSHLLYIPGAKSAEKIINHILRPLLHHLVSETPAGNTHFTFPKWGVLKETDSSSP